MLEECAMILDYSLRSPFGSPTAIKRKRLSGFRKNDKGGSVGKAVINNFK